MDGHLWRVTQEFDYVLEWGHVERGVIHVPVGFITDFASIPRALWDILPPTGVYGKAAVIHDYLYDNGGVVPGCPTFTKAAADKTFYYAMGVLGVGKVERWLMWKAVSAFGRGAFKS